MREDRTGRRSGGQRICEIWGNVFGPHGHVSTDHAVELLLGRFFLVAVVNLFEVRVDDILGFRRR